MKTNDRRKAPLGQGGVGDSVGLVAFDADDTLWDCQGAFCAVEHALAKLLSPYAEADEVLRVLAATERRNMPLTGYGAKAFTLSMVEAAVGVSRGCVDGEEIDEVLRLGRRLMELPATPLPGVEATLRRVREVVSCPVVVFTKGELRDQEGKMDRSGLRRWFDDVVTVDDKTDESYRQLCLRYATTVDCLFMVGNSFRSDIDPVLRQGGWAAYVPYHTTWAHEATAEYDHERLWRLSSIGDLVEG